VVWILTPVVWRYCWVLRWSTMLLGTCVILRVSKYKLNKWRDIVYIMRVKLSGML
jgi:hypothetical protein